MHKRFRTANTKTNGPFDHTFDINGDGWCDWVSLVAEPPHRGDLDNPRMKNFIFLGTKSGWRTFGNREKYFPTSGPLPSSKSVLQPFIWIDSFIEPSFVYSRGSSVPYVAALEVLEDIIRPHSRDIKVYRWDAEFDMMQEVSRQEADMVIEFLRAKRCSAGARDDRTAYMSEALCS